MIALVLDQAGRNSLARDAFLELCSSRHEAMAMHIRMGARAEQQALAKWGLNDVLDEYLPQKLKKAASFLP